MMKKLKLMVLLLAIIPVAFVATACGGRSSGRDATTAEANALEAMEAALKNAENFHVVVESTVRMRASGGGESETITFTARTEARRSGNRAYSITTMPRFSADDEEVLGTTCTEIQFYRRVVAEGNPESTTGGAAAVEGVPSIDGQTPPTCSVAGDCDYDGTGNCPDCYDSDWDGWYIYPAPEIPGTVTGAVVQTYRIDVMVRTRNDNAAFPAWASTHVNPTYYSHLAAEIPAADVQLRNLDIIGYDAMESIEMIAEVAAAMAGNDDVDFGELLGFGFSEIGAPIDNVGFTRLNVVATNNVVDANLRFSGDESENIPGFGRVRIRINGDISVNTTTAAQTIAALPAAALALLPGIPAN
jgi:hypothetical protein